MSSFYMVYLFGVEVVNGIVYHFDWLNNYKLAPRAPTKGLIFFIL